MLYVVLYVVSIPSKIIGTVLHYYPTTTTSPTRAPGLTMIFQEASDYLFYFHYFLFDDYY